MGETATERPYDRWGRETDRMWWRIDRDVHEVTDPGREPND